MEHVHEFLGWAWGRHHNELSWYVRALLTVPFCYFAYKRNVVGVVATLVAIVTSMFGSLRQNRSTETPQRFSKSNADTLKRLGRSRRSLGGADSGLVCCRHMGILESLLAGWFRYR